MNWQKAGKAAVGVAVFAAAGYIAWPALTIGNVATVLAGTTTVAMGAGATIGGAVAKHNILEGMRDGAILGACFLPLAGFVAIEYFRDSVDPRDILKAILGFSDENGRGREDPYIIRS